jgi:hypothetical protein
LAYFLLNFHYAICVMQGYTIPYPDELVFSLILFFVSLQYHTCLQVFFGYHKCKFLPMKQVLTPFAEAQ